MVDSESFNMPNIKLSPFQREKLEYYFNFFEPNEQGCLDDQSIDKLIKRVQKFTEWDPASMKALEFEEIHRAFFEILFEKAKEQGGTEGQVNLIQWLTLWASILPGCMGIQNFPVWLRLLPKTLFQMIDVNGDNVISLDELQSFYRDMIRIPEDVVGSRAQFAYDQMTDGGRWPLNLSSYEMIFSNFLIGKTPHGPGRHIFGCFEHTAQSFQLIQWSNDDVASYSVGPRQAAAIPWEKPKPKRQTSKKALY